jgi:S1-C subfamily serine protease
MWAVIEDVDTSSFLSDQKIFLEVYEIGTIDRNERRYRKFTASIQRAIDFLISAKSGSPQRQAGQPPESGPSASGTGFFITSDGFVVTNAHVVKGGNKFQLVTSAGSIAANVVKVDSANDLALLKAEGSFAALPVVTSRAVRLGSTVATVGFPNIGLQGFAPKLAKGEIAALSGVQDDVRYFQISVPVQPGNSGGALVDERGNVVGIVSAKLSAKAALDISGALPENVNYAVKSSFLLGFLESMPAVAAKLKEPNTKDEKFEDAVKSAEQSTVLVLVY